jgi:hypothetical protein
MRSAPLAHGTNWHRRIGCLPGGTTSVHGDEEPAETSRTFSGTDLIHAGVPIAGAHQGQTVRTQPIAVLEGANAVLVNRTGLRTHSGEVELFLLVFPKYRRRDERHDLV